jgi:hypothetical protein
MKLPWSQPVQSGTVPKAITEPGQLLDWPNSVEKVDELIYGKLQQLVIKFYNSHEIKILPVEFDDIYW